MMNDNESTYKTYNAVDSKKKVERRDSKSIILWVRNIWKPCKTSSDHLYLSLLQAVKNEGVNMKVSSITKLNNPPYIW
jgi:hypothetical protein